LAKKAAERKYPVISIPGGFPPRASMPFLLVPLLLSIGKHQIPAPNLVQIEGAVETLKQINSVCGKDSPSSVNPAKMLAEKLKGRIPVILGSPEGSDIAAFRWKTQFSENTKVTSLYDTFPEMDHNEIVNLSDPNEGKKGFSVVLLRDSAESERMQKRIDITKKTDRAVNIRDRGGLVDGRFKTFNAYYLCALRATM